MFLTILFLDNILIKNMSNSPGLENCLRVTVGSEEEIIYLYNP
jgi:histidinol-phosphate/aromatic aminotransferase/cobyric acid decarboxylase-like protein